MGCPSHSTVLQSPQFADNLTIGFHDLQVKVALLLLITTACRISVIIRLHTGPGGIFDRGDHFALIPTGFDKTTRVGIPVQELLCFDFVDNLIISPYQALKVLLERRSKSKFNLFSSDTFGKPFQVKELRVWVNSVFKLAHIPHVFKPHSIRGAVASKAAHFITFDQIMAAANWKSASVFRSYYLRNQGQYSNVETRRRFHTAVLI